MSRGKETPREAHARRIFEAQAQSDWAKRSKRALDVLVMKYTPKPEGLRSFHVEPQEPFARAASKQPPQF